MIDLYKKIDRQIDIDIYKADRQIKRQIDKQIDRQIDMKRIDKY